jgi:endonuclease/exonuclease/phosphatase family metal-dependent hydrolase
MSTTLRIATFNIENLDDKESELPSLETRIKVIRPQLLRLRADVLCLQEVNGQEFTGEPRDLLALKTMIQDTLYQDYHMVYTKTQNNEAYDKRNLVVLSRFPVVPDSVRQLRHDLVPGPHYRKVTASPPDPAADMVSWERPILYLQLALGDQGVLHLINLHLKSKLPTHIDGQKVDRFTWRTVYGWAEGSFMSSMKRVGQALETRFLIDSIFDQGDAEDVPPMIAVCGDFNDDLDSVPLNAIRGTIEETGNPDLVDRVLAPCEMSVPEPARFTLLHLGQGEMIDHILVSRALLPFYRGTEIHNEILPDESGAFRTDVKFPESDHAPVVAEFMLE